MNKIDVINGLLGITESYKAPNSLRGHVSELTRMLAWRWASDPTL